MSKWSTLVASIALMLLSGCALAEFPKFPEEVKFQYVTLVDGEELPEGFALSVVNMHEIATLSASVSCLKFEIIQPYPYKIKYLSEVPVTDCNGVGGFQPNPHTRLRMMVAQNALEAMAFARGWIGYLNGEMNTMIHRQRLHGDLQLKR